MASSLPVSRIVNVAVQMTPAAAQAQALNSLLHIDVSNVIDPTERMRSYATLAAVASDFGTSANEYKAASRWFAQTPQPTSLLIGRWCPTAAQGGLRCGTLSAAQQAMSVWNAVGATGSLKITKDGGAGVNVTAINLSAVSNMNAVAAAITAGTGWPAGTTCVWNSVYNRFELQSATLGATSLVDFLTTAGTGVDISALMLGQSTQGGYTYQGQAAETAAAAVALFDDKFGQQWYGLSVGGLVPGANAGADTTALLAVSAYVEGANTKHLFALTTQEAGALSAVVTADIAYQLKALGYKRSFCQYSSSALHAHCSALARILTVDYEGSGTAITLKFKPEPGVVAETLAASQADALKGKNCNAFVNYNNGTAIIEQGVMASGNFLDEITGTDWLAVTLQRDLYNALYSNLTKIPQTDSGMQILTTICSARCAQGVNNGLIAPGVWNSGGFGKLNQGDYLDKGYYIYAAPVATQAQADRVARKAVPIQIAVKLAGAVHSIDCTISVNQ